MVGDSSRRRFLVLDQGCSPGVLHFLLHQLSEAAHGDAVSRSIPRRQAFLSLLDCLPILGRNGGFLEFRCASEQRSEHRRKLTVRREAFGLRA